MSEQATEAPAQQAAPEAPQLPPELADIERIIHDPQFYTLAKGKHPGLELHIVRLETRQLMRLVRILTHGFSPLLQQGLNFSEPNFAQTLLMQIVMAIPDAETETIDFIRSMCEPAGLYIARAGSVLSEDETAFNAELWRKTGEALFNPNPEDLMEIVERIVQIEAPEISSLGKQARRLLSAVNKLAPPPVPGVPSLSPDLSQQPSTSSAPSTGGPTSTSSPSPSAASARSPRPSTNGSKQTVSTATS